MTVNSPVRSDQHAAPLLPEQPAIKQRNLVLLGARGVGKSACVIQYVDAHFVDVYLPTIESTFRKSTRMYGEELLLSIRDTSGQDETIVYSVTSRHSFEIAGYIRDTLLTSLLGTSDVPLLLIGNKSDLDVERQVTESEGHALAEAWGCPFMEVSAKRNENIAEAFQTCLRQIQRYEHSTDTSKKGRFECVQMPSCCKTGSSTERSERCALCFLFPVALIQLLVAIANGAIGIGIVRPKGSGLLGVGFSGYGVFLCVVAFLGLYSARSVRREFLRVYGIASVVMMCLQVLLVVCGYAAHTTIAPSSSQSMLWLLGLCVLSVVDQGLAAWLAYVSHHIAITEHDMLPAYDLAANDSSFSFRRSGPSDSSKRDGSPK